VIRHMVSSKLEEKLRSESGFALTLALAVLVLLSVSGFSVYFLAESDSTLTRHEEYRTKALHTAEAGINDYIWHMNKNENYYKTEVHEAEGQDGSGDDNYVDYQGGQYHLEVTPTSETAPGVILESTGRIQTSDGAYIYRRIKAQIKKRAFVDHLYLTDFETVEGSGATIWFITGDAIHGPLHSNDTIHIDGDPMFEGRVTTSDAMSQRSGSDPDFQQGYEEHVTPLEFPPSNTELKLTAQVDGYYYYGETTITLNSSGTLTVTNSDTSGQTTGPTGTVFLPDNNVVYIDGVVGTKGNDNNGDVYVEGTLSGKLTIAAANNIYIMGDLIYEDSENDMLGLIAENYVYILHYEGSDDVAPVDPEINAAIFALNHSFTYESYRNGSTKGTLHIHGSIVQRFRGPVGTFNPYTGSPVSGYSKDYRYDERMLYMQPPYFLEPLNSGFERVFWEEE